MEYYKKAVFTGSEGDMRFRIEKDEVEEALYDPKTGIVIDKMEEEEPEEGEEKEAVPTVKLLKCTMWKGPFAYATTKEPKLSHWAEFSDEGMTKLIAWMEEEFPKLES